MAEAAINKTLALLADLSLGVKEKGAPCAEHTAIALDKFYTKPEVVALCVDELRKTVPEVFTETVIEPSAGSGAWLPHFPGIHAYDLAPEGPDIQQQDFLQIDLKQFEGPIHFVGNPPFGTRASLVMAFMKKMSDNASTMSMSLVIPSTFGKAHCQYHKAINKKFHLVHTSDIQKNAFTIDGKNKDVNCVFQIWVRRAEDREVATKAKPVGFKWINKKDIDENTLAICVKGTYAGRIRDPEWKTAWGTKARDSVSFHFFKLDDLEDFEGFVNLYNELSADLDAFYDRRSMGSPCLQKATMNDKLNMVIKRLKDA